MNSMSMFPYAITYTSHVEFICHGLICDAPVRDVADQDQLATFSSYIIKLFSECGLDTCANTTESFGEHAARKRIQFAIFACAFVTHNFGSDSRTCVCAYTLNATE